MQKNESKSNRNSKIYENKLKYKIQTSINGDNISIDVRFIEDAQHIYENTSSGDFTTSEHNLLCVRLAGRLVHIALFPPSRLRSIGPCPECLDRRVISFLTEMEQWTLQKGEIASIGGWPFLLPSNLDRLGNLARLITDQPLKASAQKVFTTKLIDQEIVVSELMQDCFCTHCNDTPHPASLPTEMNFKTGLISPRSGNRRVHLREYTLPEKALSNPICGVVGVQSLAWYTQAITSPTFGQYSQRAHEASPRKIDWSGLSTNLLDSKIAGMLEALERQAGMHPPHRSAIPVTASYSSLRDSAMNPQLCFAYNDASYINSFGLTRFNQDIEIEWVWGYSLATRRPVLVPLQLAFYARRGKAVGPKLIDNNSNGCALGSCYEEAALKGLLELIERDSFSIGWHRQISYPKISTESCRDFRTQLLLKRLDYLGFDIDLLDARLDISTPVVIAVARRKDRGFGTMTIGASAATDPREAISGALFEAATSIVAMPQLLQQKEKHMRELLATPERIMAVSEHPLVYAFPEMAGKISWLSENPLERDFDETYADNVTDFGDDIGTNLFTLVDEVLRQGVEDIVVIDITTLEQRLLGLKTVRIIAPGLAPIDFGHPRNRVEHLPRLFSATTNPNLQHNNDGKINALPHPFP